MAPLYPFKIKYKLFIVTMTTSSKKTVRCPTCRKEIVWDKESLFRPFCSKRCKMVDLGAWLAESYRLATTENLEEEFNNTRSDEH
jgi:endogenous inhibitor of DNA gyrase (YacG/DUF329 family)